ncbi:MAG: PAS domain S-box protein [Bacteroidia bacterium]|nr:PAS domain S-box protein [Bacteroidia bacterium]
MLTKELLTQSFIIDNFSEALLIIDADGIVVIANKRVDEILHYTRDEVIGKNFNFIFRNKHLEFHEMLMFLEVDELTFEETILVRKNRKHFNAKLRIKKHGETGMQVVYIADVDKRVNYRLGVEQKVGAIEKLTKSRHIRTGQFEKAIYEILEAGSKTLDVVRVSAWLLEDDFSKIRCIGNYNSTTKKSTGEKDLYRKDFPKYFELLQTEEIIISDDALNDKNVRELLDIYIKPHGITSMMDLPIRIEGKLAGIVCFEEIGKKREWDLNEQKFGLFIAQLISLARETFERQNANKELQILLKEVNHRTKNNLNIAVSLLRLQAENAKDDFHKDLFAECGNRLLSISALHQHLYQTNSFSKVELGIYIEKIARFAEESFNAEKKATLKIKCDEVSVTITTAVSLGLITNELITNAFKHAFNGKKKGVVEVLLKKEDNKISLFINDNGKGIEKSEIKKESLGMNIVKGLADQIDAKISWVNESGTSVRVQFKG